MVEDIFKDGSEYVCISHLQLIPCSGGKNHLISNWYSDVMKVLDTIKKS